jgi:hypothetical protein
VLVAVFGLRFGRLSSAFRGISTFLPSYGRDQRGGETPPYDDHLLTDASYHAPL